MLILFYMTMINEDWYEMTKLAQERLADEDEQNNSDVQGITQNGL